MRRLGLEPRSTAWKAVILTTILSAHQEYKNYDVLKFIVFAYNSTRLKGFEPLTPRLGTLCSIQAELQAHKKLKLQNIKNYLFQKKKRDFFFIFLSFKNITCKPYACEDFACTKSAVIRMA